MSRSHHLARRILLALLSAAALLCACGGGGAGSETPTGALRLPAVGEEKTLLVPDPDATATVVFFVATECPISNYFAPEMERIRVEYGPRGIAFRAVYAVPDEGVEAIRAHTADYGLKMPALLDPEHALLSRAGASVTPEAAVFAPNGDLLYRGRIDDTYVAYGRQRIEPTQRDLRLALDAILAGASPDPSVTEAIGCFIPDLEGSSLPETSSEDH